MRSILPMLALLPAAVAGPALAQKSYDVDLVVFEHVDASSAESERWRPEVVVPALADAAGFDTSGPRGQRLRSLPDGFEQLGTEDGELVGAVERLERSDAYRVLRHTTWRQPALGPDEAVALRFDAGDPVTARMPAHMYPPAPEASSAEDSGAETLNGGTIARNTPSEFGDGRTYMPDTPFGMGMLAAPRRDAEILPLDGTVKLVVSRYLHLHANVYYTAAVELEDEDDPITRGGPTATAADIGASSRITRGPDGQTMLSYGLRQERRMRSGELHYLDHPVLGLLVKVTPHEPEP